MRKRLNYIEYEIEMISQDLLEIVFYKPGSEIPIGTLTAQNVDNILYLRAKQYLHMGKEVI